MYIEPLNCLFVQIPKNGSTSMRKAIEAKYGPQRLTGHYRESEMLEALAQDGIVPDYSVAVWRDPVDRFLSAFNHVYSDWRDVDDAMKHAIETGKQSQKLFKDQCWFLDGKDIDRHVYGFPPGAALKALGINVSRHENEGTGRWAMDDILHRVDDIRDFYASDDAFSPPIIAKIDGRTKAGRALKRAS